MITQNVTVDGVVKMLGDGFDPLDQGPGSDELGACTRVLVEQRAVGARVVLHTCRPAH